MGLWLTFLLGIFIVLGAVVVFYLQNSEKFVEFSISLATSVILMLVVTELIPEVLHHSPFMGIFKYIVIIVCILFGFTLLLVLDKFIPDHHDDEKTHKDDQKNLEHIGLISSIALVIHNVVEGMAIALLASKDLMAAFTASIGVGLHNIPLGMIIASSFYEQNKSKKKTLFVVGIVSLSTFLGGLIISFLPVMNYIEMVEAISLALTVGMLFFILFFELIPKMFKTRDKKVSTYGFVLGLILMVIAMFI